MLAIRRSEDRGHAQHGWLDSHHTFSFAGYYDPNHMGFGALRVINEDRVEPGRGFDAHSHRDMEILSYVVDGALEHRDDIGNGSVIRPGELQLMRAGTGVVHSEYNSSATDPVHFLQIWVLPGEDGLEPAYDQRAFSDDDRRGRWCLMASPDAEDGSVRVHQELRLSSTLLEPGETLYRELDPARRAWVQVVRGELEANGQVLREGDGLAMADEAQLDLEAKRSAEVLLFELE